LEESGTKGGQFYIPTISKSTFLINSQGQTFMVIGAAGDLPKPPEKPIVFLEGVPVSSSATR
jgi:hypothetical protein